MENGKCSMAPRETIGIGSAATRRLHCAVGAMQ